MGGDEGIQSVVPWQSAAGFCSAKPRFGSPVMLQDLFFLMSLVVLETEEKILPEKPFCYT